jgi:hypothetical protein
MFRQNKCPTKRAPRLRFATRGELPDPRTNAEDRRWGLPPLRAACAHPKQFSTPYHFSLDCRPPVPPERHRDVVRQGAGRTGWLDGFAVPAPAQVSHSLRSGTMAQTVRRLRIQIWEQQ